MTNPITKLPKPEAERYKDQRKLFLVPAYSVPPDVPKEGSELLERYWSEVRDHVNGLERSLGRVSHVYHEAVFSGGDGGIELLEGVNPRAFSFIRAMSSGDARLEATEDRALLEESSDWQRCLSIGLASRRVMSMAMEGYQQATKARFDHIAARIDETLAEGQAGVLFIRDDHSVQFAGDIRVFYVAPPSLDALKNWINDQVRAVASGLEKEDGPAEQAADATGDGGSPAEVEDK